MPTTSDFSAPTPVPQPFSTTPALPVPHALAQAMLNDHWDGELEVDVLRVASRLGLAVTQPLDGGRARRARPNAGVDELVCALQGPGHIYLNPYRPHADKRLALASMIGYLVSNGRTAWKPPAPAVGQGQRPFPSVQSAPCYAFALALLMPAAVFRQVIQQHRMTDIERVAQLFGVSRTAAARRIQTLIPRSR